MKRIPILVLLCQLLALALLAPAAIQLPHNNSIHVFAVHEIDEDSLPQFPSGEAFVVVLEHARSPESRQEATAFLAKIAGLKSIENHMTLASLFPNGSQAYPQTPLPLDQWPYLIGYFQPKADAVSQTLEQVFQWAADKPPQIVSIRIAGEAALNHQLNHSSLQVKERLFPILIVCVLIMLAYLFRSIHVLVISGLSVGSSLVLVLGFLAFIGEEMNLITTLVPALIFVLGVAMQVHVLIAITHHQDLLSGVRSKLRPNALITLTTSIGFASLATSPVPPIQHLGLIMALAMWVIFLTTHLTHYGYSRLVAMRLEPPKLRLLHKVANLEAYRRCLKPKPMLILGSLTIVAGITALLQNPMETNGLKYFPANSQIRQDTQFLQDQITGASQLELWILRPAKVPKPDDGVYVPDPEALTDFEHALLQNPQVRHGLSLIQLGEFSQRCEEAGLETTLQETALDPYLHPDAYRIQLLTNSLDGKAYHALEQQIQTLFDHSGLQGQLHFGGPLQQIIHIQDVLLESLGESLSLTVAFVVILLTLILGRRLPLGVLLIPNLFPLAVMALAMWLLDIPTTISSIMVFSIAFGIAVDDSIHLLHTWEKTKGTTFWERWHLTLHSDARAITLTTMVLTIGFAILQTSDFLPTAQFGTLLTIGMLAAWLGDLFILPGILASTRQLTRN